MHPILIRIGSFKLHWYGVMMALAFSAGLFNWIRLGKKEGRNAEFCSDLLLWIMVSAIVGARLAHVAANLPHFLEHPVEIFYLHRGGLIYYGGFVGAVVGVVLYARRKQEPFLSLADFAVTSVPLGHVFGRIGCFINGCCFGRPWEHAFSSRFPVDSEPWRHQVSHAMITETQAALSVYPVQLFEAGINLVIFLVLAWFYPRRKRVGEVAGLYLVMYPLARFCLEFLRGDERLAIRGLSVAQWLSVMLFAAGLMVLWISRRGSRRDDVKGTEYQSS